MNNQIHNKIGSKKDEPRINNEITAETVRVLDESGNLLGVMSIQEAFDIADKENKDLIERVQTVTCSSFLWDLFRMWLWSFIHTSLFSLHFRTLRLPR